MIVRVDLDDIVGTLFFAHEKFQSFLVVARGNDAIGDFSLDESGRRLVADIGEGDEVTEGRHAVGASGSGIGAGQRRIVEVLDVIDKAGFLEFVV